jgi:hypothetical protein
MKKAVLWIFGATALFAAGADYAADGKLWWAHIQFLADDRLEGRAVGTDGLRKAVEYVARRFQSLGLKPAGTSGFLQNVKFKTAQVENQDSTVTLVRGANSIALATGTEVSISPRLELPSTMEAPLVFAGYGMTIPEANYDDLAGLDVRGKIVVYVSAAGPAEAPGPLKSHLSSGVERWNALHKAGAIGVAAIPNPRPAAARQGEAEASGEAPLRNAPPRPPTFVLADRELQETEGQKVALLLNPRGAAKLFEGSDHTFEEIQKLARANEPLPRFELPGTLRVKTSVKHGSAEAPNVVAVLNGSDPALKEEYVVMSAHLDHVGVGRPVNGDSIYNGAMDDASGIASLLEVARLAVEAPQKPKRSILFVAVTAEEKGELGSRYFAAHPTVPASRIVADINLDMFLPLYALKFLEVQGLDESTLGDTVREAARELGVEVQRDNEPEQNRFIRSDQYSFIRRGIPALAFKFGYEQGSKEEQIRRDWVRDRYHKPSDDLSQPVDTAAAALFDRVIAGLIERVADDPARPQWKPDSFFRRFAN